MTNEELDKETPAPVAKKPTERKATPKAQKVSAVESETFGQPQQAAQQPFARPPQQPAQQSFGQSQQPIFTQQPLAPSQQSFSSPAYFMPQAEPPMAGASVHEAPPKDFFDRVSLRLKYMKENISKSLKTSEGKNKALQLALAMLLFIITIASLFSPIIKNDEFRVTPWKLMWSQSQMDIDYGFASEINLMYQICKYFYIVMSLGCVAVFIYMVFVLVTGKKKLSTYLSYIMGGWVLYLLLSMLMSFNYINLYSASDMLESTTSSTGFFIFGLILLITKIIVHILYGRDEVKDMLKESGLSIALSFILFTLLLGTLITPIYVFPGSADNMFGKDVILNRYDVLEFYLQMSGGIKVIYRLFFFGGIISFIITLILYLFKREWFVHYNNFNIFFGVAALVVFALIGANYVIIYLVYLTEGIIGMEAIFSISMNTYAYIPLVFLLMACAGIGLTKLTLSKINVEYKVYAGGGGGRVGTGQKAIQEEVSVLDPIPAFSEMDTRMTQFESEYQEKKTHLFADLTLPKLVSHIIEYAARSKERLSYGRVEIKSFIAGLAASRLAILQGMSGTGKTSLPKIFMEAVDGCCDLVAVESSWRDKHELTGYYNEFNKKYTPKSFTQYLYKAALTPEVPYFIVLDELNLSRIEYYFSDFLSLMESREDDRYIKLFDVQLYPYSDERTEYLAIRDGHTLDIPKNVWFIGTANRDESTFEISDKVYDRAQTIIFEKRAPKVHSKSADYPKRFVPYSELNKLFEQARTIDFDAESYAAIRKVESLLASYRISFGNRVLKQMEDFVRVYIACSDVAGNADFNRFMHEGVDCILLSKVVRKLELKQINDLDYLIEEFEALNLPKCTEFLRGFIENE